MTVPAGGTVQFTAPGPVAWRVVAPTGVDGGTISNGGLYQAPTRVPPDGSVLVQATAGSGQVSAATVVVASTTANGGFVPVTTTKTLGQTLVADLDRDGVPDVLDIFGSADFRKGLGDGTFAQPVLSYAGAIGQGGNVLADLNGDGIPDLIGIDTFQPPAPIGTVVPDLHVALGQGDGTFQSYFDRNSGLRPRSVADADFNGDGKNDLAMVDELLRSVTVFFNDSTGSFFSSVSMATVGTTPTELRTGDLNGDGRPDLVTGNRGDATVSAFVNQGGTFAPARVLSLGFVPPDFSLSINQIELADLNADGMADLVVNSFQGTQSFLSAGDGSFGTAVAALPAGFFALGHADADSKLDLVLSTATGADLYRGNGNGSFTRVGAVIDGYPTSTLNFTELNRDGNYDLLARVFDGQQFVVATLFGGPVAAPSLAVSVTPHAATVNAALTLELHPQVTGTLDGRVDWFVNGIAGGDANVGTITVVDRYTAVYTAPEPIGAVTSVTIEARSALNAAVKDAVAIDLTNYHWLRLSNGLTNVDVHALAYAADASRVYAGTTNGLFRSDDDGLRWLPASGSGSQSLPSVQIFSLAVDPTNPLVVYAGTRGKGIYKSTDGGTTWTAINALSNNPFGSLASAVISRISIAPYDPRKIVAEVNFVFDSSFGVGPGSYRSTDGGATWLRLGDPSNTSTDIAGVVLDPGHANVLYGGSPSGFVRSSDFGGSFTPFATNLSVAATDIQVDPFDGNHLIIVGRMIRNTSQGPTLLDPMLHETRDGGATWHSGLFGLPRGNNLTVRFSPSTPGLVLVGHDVGGTFVSTDSIFNFHDISTGLSAGSSNLLAQALAIRPRKAGEAAGSERFFVGTAVGVFGSTTTFLSVPQLRITPANPTVAAGGSITLSAGEAVNWRVAADPGVNAGTITVAGVYTAPARVPPSGFVTVVGESVATGARGTATIAIASTSADGTFAPVTALPVSGLHPVIDVDGDGIGDMVDVPRQSIGIEVRKGLGDGTFAAPILSSFVSPGRDFFRLGDLNGDGLPDLVGVDTFPAGGSILQPNMHVALNVGGDRFLPFTDLIAALRPREVLLEDVNGDSARDLIVLDEGLGGSGSSLVYVLLNDGRGNLGAPIAYRTGGPQAIVMTARDVNNDGRTDIVVGNNDGSIATLLNRGGTFGSAVVNALGVGLSNFPRFNQIALADLDEDGNLDLVVPHFELGFVTILRGDGTGGFTVGEVL
ncbi:MAG TPA: FG-GAP-like repeat-containing protein, partial [Gemmataceae bacterium]|nr:FG-GAP-like repeat-containing protein [Gemmataceae bacterium]